MSGLHWAALLYVDHARLLSESDFIQVIALYNGGPAGVIYEFIAVACCYFMIAACIAEMASSIPSSAGVYHWASVAGGARFGKVIGFYAGWYVRCNPRAVIKAKTDDPQVECPRLDLRHGFYNLYPRQPSHIHVRPVSPGLCV